LVRGVRGFERGVEAVGVLHDELFGAHQAEPRADFVAELGLDLVDRAGELAVRADLAGQEFGDDLLVGRPERHQAVGPVLEAEHAGTHGGEPSGAFPEFGGL